MKRALITGGVGFIGSQFVRSFINKYELGILDSLTYASDMKRIPDQLWQDINFYHKDIRNLDDVLEVYKAFKPDVVAHFGAESHVDNSIKNPHIFMETNVLGTLNMLIGAVQHPVETFINISTDEVYGASINPAVQMYETSHFDPSSPYSVSKASADMLGQSYYKMYNLPVITVRPCNNMGEWQNGEKFIPTVLSNICNDREIPVYGNGQQVREWIHIEDCCEAIELILQKGQVGEAYNIAGMLRKKNIDLIHDIGNLLQKTPRIKHVTERLAHDIAYRNYDGKLQELGWKNKSKYVDRLKQVVDWYSQNMK